MKKMNIVSKLEKISNDFYTLLGRVNYFKNKSYAKENNDRMKSIGLDKCRIEGWNCLNGKIMIMRYDEMSNIRYADECNACELRALA